MDATSCEVAAEKSPQARNLACGLCLLGAGYYRQFGLLFRHLADVLGDAHGAELGAAHRAKLRGLEHFLGQRFIVHGPRGLRVERELELAVPVELEAGLG